MKSESLELLTLSLQPCPDMRCLMCPPLLGWLCSWRSLLISCCPTESRERESKTLRHASHSSHCRHLSASTRPETGKIDKRKENRENLLLYGSTITQTNTILTIFFNSLNKTMSKASLKSEVTIHSENGVFPAHVNAWFTISDHSSRGQKNVC